MHPFNRRSRITIDGDTSTNDMVLILANGMSGVVVEDQVQIGAFQAVLDSVLNDLARMIVRDGEGATKLVEILVNGATSDADARLAAETIANSSLVKTALFGEDANWGRIIAAAGRAGVVLDPDGIDIFFNSVCMARKPRPWKSNMLKRGRTRKIMPNRSTYSCFVTENLRLKTSKRTCLSVTRQ